MTSDIAASCQKGGESVFFWSGLESNGVVLTSPAAFIDSVKRSHPLSQAGERQGHGFSASSKSWRRIQEIIPPACAGAFAAGRWFPGRPGGLLLRGSERGRDW